VTRCADYLARQQQDQRLEQQREAGQLAGELGLDQHDFAIGQLHPGGAHLQVALVLEEVQVPVGLDDRVMHRVNPVASGHRKAAARLEVDRDGECLGGFVELGRSHRPRHRDPQGLLEQSLAHHHLPPGPSPITRRTRPRASVFSCVPRPRVRCAGPHTPRPALDPISTAEYPLEIQERPQTL